MQDQNTISNQAFHKSYKKIQHFMPQNLQILTYTPPHNIKQQKVQQLEY